MHSVGVPSSTSTSRSVSIVLGVRAIADDRPSRIAESFDYLGAVLFTIGLVTLLVSLDQGHAWGWTSPLTLGLVVLAVVVLIAFVRVERNQSHPMLDLSLSGSRVFSAASMSALFNYICVYSVLFVLPFLLIQGRGLNTQRAGLVLTAQPIVMAIVAPISGALSDRIGSRWLATGGMIILAIGLADIARLAARGSLGAIALGLSIIGLGIGLFVSPNNSALMGAAPRHRQGIAAGVLATARNVGMVLGVGLAGAVFTTIIDRGGPSPLVHGVQGSLMAAVGVAALGAITAFVRE